jgi:hypothetical protein
VHWAFVAAIPILLALLLLVGIRLPAKIAMPICAGTTVISAWWLWQVPTVRIAASIVDAASVTVSILMIVFGALFFLAVLRHTKAIDVLQRFVSGLSDDPRIQVVLVGWLFGSFLEGSAGFGSPAAITAPLLIGLGFRPVLAVVVALVGDSTAVSFGAIGTPMLIGFGQGLAQSRGGSDGTTDRSPYRFSRSCSWDDHACHSRGHVRCCEQRNCTLETCIDGSAVCLHGWLWTIAHLVYRRHGDRPRVAELDWPDGWFRDRIWTAPISMHGSQGFSRTREFNDC